MSRVVIVFTGGTIASRFDPSVGGRRALLAASEILSSVAGIEEIAEIDAIDWGRVPASQFTFSQLLELAAIIKDALQREDVDGAVLVQGSDSIEEMAYGLDLLISSPKPVAVVGAMRSADQPGFDGPANLRDAVRCVTSPELRGQGVVVTMAGEIHAADDVTKTHPDAYNTFKSLNFGPLGYVRAGRIELSRTRRHQPHIATDVAGEPVYLFTSVIGCDGTLIRAARRLGARGLVIAGAGLGNTPVDMLLACTEALADNIPVMLATRCPSGRTLPEYAFAGAAFQWQAAGAILAGPLAAPKARIAMTLGIGGGLSRDELAAVVSW